MPFDPNDAEAKAALKAAADEAVEAAVSGLKAKNAELIADLKEARKGKQIDPAEVERIEAERDKARADLVAAQKAAKDATTAADKATKALEAEQGAARSYALDAEIAQAIASGNVIPALVPAFTAMVKQQAKADLVDGKYAVTIGDKAVKDHISAFLGSDDGKHFRAAAVNGGGGAPGGKGANDGGKAVSDTQLAAMSPKERAAHFAAGGSIASEAA